MEKLFWTTVLLVSAQFGSYDAGSDLAQSDHADPRSATDRCSATDLSCATDSSHQGIEGLVYPVSGNQMPSPDIKASSPRGIKSTLCIFKLTHLAQAVPQGKSSYYSAVTTHLVKEADTDDTGHFKVQLPPGVYSLFTRKGNLYYATRRDEKNNIAPVEVVAGKFTRVDCKIEGDRKAVY